jgi:proteasome lid subunit RPN8/RPN11
VKTRIQISQNQLAQLIDLAKLSLPNESCALLAGEFEEKETYTEIRVLKILTAKNADKSVISFSIDEMELIDLYEKAEADGLQVVSIFHSHPSKPIPSSTDLKFMKINPIVWLIYSSIMYEFRAYILTEELEEVEIERS